MIGAAPASDAKFFSKKYFSNMGRWMSLFRAKSLSRRILAPVLPSILAVTTITGIFSYHLVKRQIVDSVRQTMDGEAENTARTFEAFFQQRLNDLDSLSET